MKKTVIGILAHVDAGKTTLSEAMLYCTGATRTLGRVDHGSAFLDNFEMERRRGITIFSKQAIIKRNDMEATLLDTPGHVDFAAETERVMDVLDCAIMVISSPDGVQSHTRTLWKLLRQRNIPVFIFANKMDQDGADRDKVLEGLERDLGGIFFDYRNPDLENVAMADESIMEEYLEEGEISRESIIKAVRESRIFPCWFGAALKLEGVEEFLDDISEAAPSPEAKSEFAAKVFKITRDDQGNRLTHMKITGGNLKIRDSVVGEGWEEKITRLRVYSGVKYESLKEAGPGTVVAAAGLTETLPGMGLGNEEKGRAPELVPVLTYSVILPEGCDIAKAMMIFRQLEEEDPALHMGWDQGSGNLLVQLMGPIQLEILRNIILDRYGLEVEFGKGQILYRETIKKPVEGVGHYEPLRHYAEVHLVISPAERGSGILLKSECSEDVFDRNWQRLVMTHLAEKDHLGVLTGSPITDVEISITAGRDHAKHTSGGDFRQATYRAIRQGLMKAESILLEPWYEFRMELPGEHVGRALTDLERMGAVYGAPEIEGDYSVISGSAPVASMGEYSQEFKTYTRGLGHLFFTFKGYEPCVEAEKVIESIGYNAEADLDNSPDSVFCSHGSGHIVKWNEVEKYMHLESTLNPPRKEEARKSAQNYLSRVASDDELMAIFERTYGPVKRDKTPNIRPVKRIYGSANVTYKSSKKIKQGPEYLLVDGYNIIFSWEELKELAKISIDAARNALIDTLRNYQGFKNSPVIIVFDAYKVKGNPGSIEHYGDLTVVYTKEAEIADTYIERAAYKLSKDNLVKVATNDRLEQMIILGNGALKMSSETLQLEVQEAEAAIRELLEEYRTQSNLKNPGNRPVIKE